MKKINKIACMLYLILEIVIVSMFFIEFEASIFDGNILENILNILFLLISPCLVFFPFYLFVFMSNFAYNKGKHANLTKIDFEKSKEYYREIIKNYSPAELSYIDDFRIDDKKDVITNLLSLELKKKIKIHKQTIEILEITSNNLKNSEAYVLSCIQTNNNKSIIKLNKSKFKEIVINEALQDILIKNDTIKNHYKNIIGTIVYLVILFYLYRIRETICFDLIYGILSVFGKGLIILGIGYLIGYLYGIKNIYHIRTTKGNDINIQLEGLKSFLKDFGNLSIKEQEELPLWREYLIYSVLFNQNKKVIQELKKLIILE